MMSSFKGKKVWITGASSGLGKAMAIAFSKEGARLILSARKVERLEPVKELCTSSPEVTLIPLDLADGEGIDEVFEIYKEQIQDVDILINNAGISQRATVRETNWSVFEKLNRVNYLGTLRLSMKMLEFFDKRKSGHFVVISSMAGKFGVPLRSGYSGAKMGLHGFFEALRAESPVGQPHITMVCPGFIRTNVSINALTGSGTPQGKMDDAQDGGMSPEEFAKVVLSAIENKKEEVLIGGFRETRLASLVNRLFPSTFRNLIRRSKVT